MRHTDPGPSLKPNRSMMFGCLNLKKKTFFRRCLCVSGWSDHMTKHSTCLCLQWIHVGTCRNWIYIKNMLIYESDVQSSRSYRMIQVGRFLGFTHLHTKCWEWLVLTLTVCPLLSESSSSALLQKSSPTHSPTTTMTLTNHSPLPVNDSNQTSLSDCFMWTSMEPEQLMYWHRDWPLMWSHIDGNGCRCVRVTPKLETSDTERNTDSVKNCHWKKNQKYLVPNTTFFQNKCFNAN